MGVSWSAGFLEPASRALALGRCDDDDIGNLQSERRLATCRDPGGPAWLAWPFGGARRRRG